VLPDTVPIVALTATATPRVQEDITVNLNLRSDMFVFKTTFNRPNLQYHFFLKRGKDADITEISRRIRNSGNASTIVYAQTQKICDALVLSLSASGIKTVKYHAGMDNQARRQAHFDFISDKAQVIVGTIAFGMGIDKPDVRLVIHYGCPKTLEAYYQQTGRAGRDGQTSVCLAFWGYVSRPSSPLMCSRFWRTLLCRVGVTTNIRTITWPELKVLRREK